MIERALARTVTFLWFEPVRSGVKLRPVLLNEPIPAVLVVKWRLVGLSPTESFALILFCFSRSSTTIFLAAALSGLAIVTKSRSGSLDSSAQ